MIQDSEQHSEIEKLRAFEQRMQSKGAAAFGDGLEPWNEWRETDTSAAKRTWGCDRQQVQNTGGSTMCEKLLSTMATVAVVVLTAGIGGVYLSVKDDQPAMVSAIQPAPVHTPTTVQTDSPSTGTVRRNMPSDNRPTATKQSQTGPVAAITAAHVAPVPAEHKLDSPEPAATTGVPNIAQSTGTNTGVTPAAQNTDISPAPFPAQQLTGISAESLPPSKFAKGDVSAELPSPAAGINAADAPAKLATVARPVTSSPATEITRDGIWVINISSYFDESLARDKLDEFSTLGVDAEIHPVTIKGKPMFRIRTTGYETRQEAETWVSLLQDRLGIQGAWVSKR